MLTVEDFDETIRLLKQGWTQAVSARDQNGRICNDLFSIDAVSFCLTGAITRAIGPERMFKIPGDFLTIFIDYLRKAFPQNQSFEYITNWNDHPNRTKEEVITLVEKAKEIFKSEN